MENRLCLLYEVYIKTFNKSTIVYFILKYLIIYTQNDMHAFGL